MDLRGGGCEERRYMELVQDRIKWPALIITGPDASRFTTRVFISYFLRRRMINPP
jgi:hypothetical protein